MEIQVLTDAAAVAKKAASIVAAEARTAISARGRFVFAVSGGQTPWLMLKALVDESLSWDKVHLVQVDERIAPAGHADRNLTHINQSLLSLVPIPPDHVHAMPVNASDVDGATKSYVQSLSLIAGSPPVLDLVHLGLGSDGHTASLIPGDPVLNVTDAEVALTEEYQGRRRMTLTYPIINRSRRILWLITGSEKAGRLIQLRDADSSIPAGRIDQNRSIVLADRAAGAQLEKT